MLSRFMCPFDRRGIYTGVSEPGLKFLEEARPTSGVALREGAGHVSRLWRARPCRPEAPTAWVTVPLRRRPATA